MINPLKDQLSKKSTNNFLQVLKWVVLFIFLFFAWRFFQWDQFSDALNQLSFQGIALYVLVIFFSRIIYAYRWQLIGAMMIEKVRIPLAFFFQTNLLAEFVTIVMPSSLGGEVTRVLKLNSRGSRTTLSTASILIDRALGIGGMLAVSLASLALIGQKIVINIEDLVPQELITPLVILVMLVFVLVIIGGFIWLRNPVQKQRFVRAWSMVKNNIPLLIFAFLTSMAAHVIFSLAHFFLLRELFPLNPLEIIAVILTPQLARSIPVSVLGISAGEGLMVAGQMMIGIPKETALLVTLAALASRYFFAILGFLIEFLRDGIHFFKQVRPTSDEGSDDPL